MEVRVRAARVAQWRRARGLTQRELARLLGVTQNYVPALESGTRDPGPKLRGPLMSILGADFWELFDVMLVEPDGTEILLQPRAGRPPQR